MAKQTSIITARFPAAPKETHKAWDSSKDHLCYYKHENIISFAIIHETKYVEIYLIHYDTSVFIEVKTMRREMF